MKKKTSNVMSLETAQKIVDGGAPARLEAEQPFPAEMAHWDRVLASNARRAARLAHFQAQGRHEFALAIVERGRESVVAQLDKQASARRVNGCGCDNAPDCLCNLSNRRY